MAGIVMAMLLVYAVWWQEERGYPGVVYYLQVSITTNGSRNPASILEEWEDPQRGTILDKQGADFLLLQDGQQYVSSPLALPVSALISGSYNYPLIASLDSHGFAGVGDYYRAHVTGPIQHLMFHGLPALQFFTSGVTCSAQCLAIVWIDARTHVPLQAEGALNSSSIITVRWLHAQRIPSYTLPAGFFEPPKPSLWDRFVGWTEEKLGKH